MSNPTNETFGQARQGSVAAIIQILNENLVEIGIRVRAVVADGMLQILCEANSIEKLEKQPVISRVRQVLENISPQRISKVKINSRLVKEGELLWLEEINRDPENALLWSEIITLKKPFFVRRWIRDRNLKPAGPLLRDISEPDPKQGKFPGKLIGSLAVLLVLLAAGWLFRSDIARKTAQIAASTRQAPPTAPADGVSSNGEAAANADRAGSGNSSEAGDRAANTTPQNPPQSEPTVTPPQTDSTEQRAVSSGVAEDAFAEAVRIANTAAADGQNADTVAEWLDLATRWQKASDLMAQIPSTNDQYALAQDRVASYADNSQMALDQAATLQQ